MATKKCLGICLTGTFNEFSLHSHTLKLHLLLGLQLITPLPTPSLIHALPLEKKSFGVRFPPSPCVSPVVLKHIKTPLAKPMPCQVSTLCVFPLVSIVVFPVFPLQFLILMHIFSACVSTTSTTCMCQYFTAKVFMKLQKSINKFESE